MPGKLNCYSDTMLAFLSQIAVERHYKKGLYIHDGVHVNRAANGVFKFIMLYNKYMPQLLIHNGKSILTREIIFLFRLGIIYHDAANITESFHQEADHAKLFVQDISAYQLYPENIIKAVGDAIATREGILGNLLQCIDSLEILRVRRKHQYDIRKLSIWQDALKHCGVEQQFALYAELENLVDYYYELLAVFRDRLDYARPSKIHEYCQNAPNCYRAVQEIYRHFAVLQVYKHQGFYVRGIKVDAVEQEFQQLHINELSRPKHQTLRDYVKQRQGQVPESFKWRPMSYLRAHQPYASGLLMSERLGVLICTDSVMGTEASFFYDGYVNSDAIARGNFDYDKPLLDFTDQGSLSALIVALAKREASYDYFGVRCRVGSEILGTYQIKSIRGIVIYRDTPTAYAEAYRFLQHLSNPVPLFFANIGVHRCACLLPIPTAELLDRINVIPIDHIYLPQLIFKYQQPAYPERAARAIDADKTKHLKKLKNKELAKIVHVSFQNHYQVAVKHDSKSSYSRYPSFVLFSNPMSSLISPSSSLATDLCEVCKEVGRK